MSLHAAQPPTGPNPPIPSRSSEGKGPKMTPTSGISSTNAANKVKKPRWTSKRTRNQFSVYLNPQRHRPRVPGKNAESATRLQGYAITASPEVSPSDKAQQLAAGMQTAVEDEPVDSLLRLQTNEANSHLTDLTPSTVVTNATVDDTAQESTEMYDDAAPHAGAASVPRSYDYTDLTILSDDSDQEATADSPAAATVMHDEPLFFSEAKSSMNRYLVGIAPPEAKTERVSPSKRPRTGIHVTNTGARREIIFIESSDEGDSGDDEACSPIRRLTLAEASFDVPTSEPHKTSAEDIYSPTHAALFAGSNNTSAENESSFDRSASEPCETRLNLEESSFDVPTSEPPAIPMEDICSAERSRASPVVGSNNANAEDESSEDNIPLAVLRKEASFGMPTLVPRATSRGICSATRTPTTAFVGSHNANTDNESSEDNVPLSILRRNRLRNKRRLSDDEEIEFTIVNRPTPAVRQRVTTRQQPKDFDSDTFDAMIYRQSEVQPPFGLSVPRPTTSSSAGPRDDRAFVHANPAIHGRVVRTEKWLKDKAREIRSRPNRKRWFGKPVERMRWLYNKQVEDKMKRQTQNKASAGHKMRQDPQPAGYKRVMDFGDVPKDRLPREVLSNPAWVKACEWQRKMREEDVALWREVEHRTHMTWQHYQDVLQEDD